MAMERRRMRSEWLPRPTVGQNRERFALSTGGAPPLADARRQPLRGDLGRSVSLDFVRDDVRGLREEVFQAPHELLNVCALEMSLMSLTS